MGTGREWETAKHNQGNQQTGSKPKTTHQRDANWQSETGNLEDN